MVDPFSRALHAERIAAHAMKFVIAANRAWVQENVNWEAETRREFLWLRRNLLEFEQRHFPAKNSSSSPAEGRAGNLAGDAPYTSPPTPTTEGAE